MILTVGGFVSLRKMTVGYDCALGSVARGWLVEGLGLDLEL